MAHPTEQIMIGQRIGEPRGKLTLVEARASRLIFVVWVRVPSWRLDNHEARSVRVDLRAFANRLRASGDSAHFEKRGDHGPNQDQTSNE